MTEKLAALKYEVRHSSLPDGELMYEAVDNTGTSLGWLTYQPEEDKVIELIAIRSLVPRVGIARTLLKSLTQLLPSDTSFNSVIIHGESLEKLKQLGLLDEAKIHSEIRVLDPTVLNAVPIVQVLCSGDIQTTLITITYISQYENTEDFAYTIYWEGQKLIQEST